MISCFCGKCDVLKDYNNEMATKPPHLLIKEVIVIIEIDLLKSITSS
jgi:hypothetical protein